MTDQKRNAEEDLKYLSDYLNDTLMAVAAHWIKRAVAAEERVAENDENVSKMIDAINYDHGYEKLEAAADGKIEALRLLIDWLKSDQPLATFEDDVLCIHHGILLEDGVDLGELRRQFREREALKHAEENAAELERQLELMRKASAFGWSKTGSMLQKKRDKQGLSARQLAEDLGVTAKQIHEWEFGLVDPSAHPWFETVIMEAWK